MNKKTVVGLPVALILVVLFVLKLDHNFTPTSLPSSPSVSVPTTSATSLKPDISDKSDILKAAAEFTRAYWSYSPTDSPAAIKKRVSRLVVDPLSFNWQTNFGVSLARVEASMDPTFTQVEFFASGSYLVTARIKFIETDPSTGATREYRGHSFWQVFFTEVNGRWLAEALYENVPYPSQTN